MAANSSLFTIGAFAFIFDEAGRILLSHRRDLDLWNPPGGGVETNESPWAAVVREVKEEICADVTVDRLFGVYCKPVTKDVVFCFTCQITGGVPALSNEVDQIKYFAVNNLPKNLTPKFIERIRDALQKKADVILKEQHGPSSRELLKQGFFN